MDHPTPSSPLITAMHCAHLRHKGMYVMAEEDPVQSGFNGHEATAFWCARTQTSFGPDGAVVRQDLCRKGRGCCE